MVPNYNKSEIKLWLEICLKKQNIKDIVVENLKYSEIGDGFVGDIVFAQVLGKAEDGLPREYNFVLKCSKSSTVLREVAPTKQFFLNEIYIYETLMPAFTKFQLNQGIQNPFNSFPKYYGSFINDEREVVALEDLISNGYGLWDRKKPMTRSHINLIVEEYAKFHAISAAMQSHFLEEYEALTKPLTILEKEFEKNADKMILKFTFAIEDVYKLLRGDLDDEILTKWKNFGKYMESAFMKILSDYRGLKVVNHGDSWNNNFMFQVEDNDANRPTKVSILDWQIIKLHSPVSDLSHFLFTCISEGDIKDLRTILDRYYNCFLEYLIKLKASPEIYPKKQFLDEWKQYSKLGILFVPMAVKASIREKEEVVDMAEAAEQGDFTRAFEFDVQNKTLFKDRMIHVVKYVVENNLI